MRSIFPSVTIFSQREALISTLRDQGFTIGTTSAAPRPGDLFLIAEGEPVLLPARTIIVATGKPSIVPGRDGCPHRITFDRADAAIGDAFVRVLVGGPDLPTAADSDTLALFALAEWVAQTDISVLINGPTGTGKEVLARLIHTHSQRAGKPFIAINCAALPETMLEALLFGHEKGAFTGASSSGEGFFRAADGGTILLDEIAEMPLPMQAKLLRVLQEREVVPIGASVPQPTNVRVVACANRDLQVEVAAGRFRADLYYRLAVFPLTTKRLAERPDDILALVATMIMRHAGYRALIPWPTRAALDALLCHDWPGNVRELENVVQRAMVLASDERIDVDHVMFDRPIARSFHLGETTVVAAPADTLSNVVQTGEFQAIRDTLAACNGSRIETARRLGISERTLRYRIAKAREQGYDLAQVVPT
jgi:two-component system response regulator FlrC